MSEEWGLTTAKVLDLMSAGSAECTLMFVV